MSEFIGGHPMRGATLAFQQAGGCQKKSARTNAGNFSPLFMHFDQPVVQCMDLPDALREVGTHGGDNDQVRADDRCDLQVWSYGKQVVVQFHRFRCASQRYFEYGFSPQALIKRVRLQEHFIGAHNTAEVVVSVRDENGELFHRIDVVLKDKKGACPNQPITMSIQHP